MACAIQIISLQSRDWKSGHSQEMTAMRRALIHPPIAGDRIRLEFLDINSAFFHSRSILIDRTKHGALNYASCLSLCMHVYLMQSDGASAQYVTRPLFAREDDPQTSEIVEF